MSPKMRKNATARSTLWPQTTRMARVMIMVVMNMTKVTATPACTEKPGFKHVQIGQWAAAWQNCQCTYSLPCCSARILELTLRGVTSRLHICSCSQVWCLAWNDQAGQMSSGT